MTTSYLPPSKQTGSFVQRTREMRHQLPIGQPKLMAAIIQSVFRHGLPNGWGK